MILEDYRREDERLDDLQRNGLWILQKPSAFRFGMDAVLLANFATIRPRERIADFGTGTGVLPLLMSQREGTAVFEAIEWQEPMADMARRSVLLNGLQARIRVHCGDFRNAVTLLGRETMDAVVCNPPYGKSGGTLGSQTEEHLLARHETDGTLDQLMTACASVLRNHGRLSMVFPAPRMLEAFNAMQRCRLEPKRLRMVCAKADRAPYLVLMEAIKNAKPMLHHLPPLVVYNADGTETEELKRIYHLPTGEQASASQS